MVLSSIRGMTHALVLTYTSYFPVAVAVCTSHQAAFLNVDPTQFLCWQDVGHDQGRDERGETKSAHA